MVRAEKKVQVNFQTNSDLLERARTIVKSHNLDMSKSFNLFLETIVATESLPVLTEDELEKERLFAQLQKEVQSSYAEIGAGKFYTDEDLVERYGL